MISETTFSNLTDDDKIRIILDSNQITPLGINCDIGDLEAGYTLFRIHCKRISTGPE